MTFKLFDPVDHQSNQNNPEFLRLQKRLGLSHKHKQIIYSPTCSQSSLTKISQWSRVISQWSTAQLVWKTSQAGRIWGRPYVLFLYYVLMSLALERLCLDQFQNEYSDLRAIILRNQGRIAVRSVPRTHLKGYYLVNLIYINSVISKMRTSCL